MAKKKAKTTGCGDWHLGWGYGYNKIGVLTLNEDGSFTWNGHAQGRHGQILSKGNTLHFRYTPAGAWDPSVIDIIEQKGGYPANSELEKAIKELLSGEKMP